MPIAVTTITPGAAPAIIIAGHPRALSRPLSMETFDALYGEVVEEQRARRTSVPFLGRSLVGLGLTVPGRVGYGFEMENVGSNNRTLARALYAEGLAGSPSVDNYHTDRGGCFSYQEDASCGGEWVSPISYGTESDLRKMERGIEIHRAHGASPDDSAGLHVHRSVGHWRDNPQLHRTFAWLFYACQDVLYRMSAPNAINHRDNQYCRPISAPPPVLRRPADLYATQTMSGRVGGQRYRALNAQHVAGTQTDHLEFRIYNSSLHAGIMEAQIKLTLGLFRIVESFPLAVLESLPALDRGTHLARNPRERFLSGPEWEAQTAQFRQLLALMFHEPEEIRQMIALFALGRWQPVAGAQRQVRSVKESPIDQRLYQERRGRLSLTTGRMDNAMAERVAALLNARANLTVTARSSWIARDQDQYRALVDGNGELAAVMRFERAQWYQGNVSRFTWEADREPATVARPLLAAVEAQARAAGVSLIQTTVEEDDTVMRALLTDADYDCVARFCNARSGHLIGVWQRILDRAQLVLDLTPDGVAPGEALPVAPAPALVSLGLTLVEGEGIGPGIATQIAALVNARNRLLAPHTEEGILAARAGYSAAILPSPDGTDESDRLARGTVVGCVEVTKVSWYQQETRHLSLLPEWEGRGLARSLMACARAQAVASGARLLQATVRAANPRARRVAAMCGYTPLSEFLPPDTDGRERLEVWGAVLARGEGATDE